MTGTIRVEPSGRTFGCGVGQTVMEAALDAGYSWPTVCHGDADCAVCTMDVLAGTSLLGEVSDVEAATLQLAPPPTDDSPRRLACQARLVSEGEVTVRKRGVRPVS